MHSDLASHIRLTGRGIGCLPAPAGDPARETSGRTLDHVAGVYDLLEPLMMMGMDRPLRQEVIALLDPAPGGRILDVGCGTGTLTREIAGRLPEASRSCVVGVDAARAMIAVARRKAAGLPNVVFEAALAERLPFADGTFDGAVSTMFFHHINVELKRRALAEIWRTLTPAGRLVVADVAAPTTVFGALCAWAGFVLFQQAEIRENIEGKLEEAFRGSPFRTWRAVTRHAGYISVYVLEK